MVRSIQQLEALRDDWSELAVRHRSPLLDHDWFLSCAEAFAQDGTLRVVTVREGGCLTGVAPLVAADGRLVGLGTSHLFEPTDWLSASPQAATTLAAHVLGERHTLVMQRIPRDSAAVGALSAQPRRRAFTIMRPSTPALAVDTRQPWSTYQATLSSLVRSNLARLRRRAERELGPMTVEFLQPRPFEVDGHLQTFMGVEDSGWKHVQRSSLALRSDLRAFFSRYCARLAAQGQLRVHILRFGSETAAVELSVAAYDRIWQLKIGYEHSLRRFYPGLHLTAASIRAAFDERCEAYEFLGSAEDWERRWRPTPRGFVLMVVYPSTPSGLGHAIRDAIGIAARRLARVGTEKEA